MNTLMKRNGNGQVPAPNFGGLVDQLFQDNLSRFFDDNFWGVNANASRSQLPVNIREADKSYELEFLAPGLKKEDLKIQVADGLLTVSYDPKENAAETNGWLRREFRHQAFSRSFSLEDTVEGDNITARYDNGILYLSIPKKPSAQKVSRDIQIQ